MPIGLMWGWSANASTTFPRGIAETACLREEAWAMHTAKIEGSF